MRKKTDNIRGIQYSQESLAKRGKNLEDVTGGQKVVFRLLIILFTFILLVISGCLTGILGATLSTSFLLFSNQNVYLWIILSVTTAVIIWLIETTRLSFAQGLWKAALSIVAMSSIALIVFSELDIPPTILFFTILAVGDAALSLVFGALSSALIIILFDKNKRYVKKIYFLQIIVFILVTFLIAYLYGNILQQSNSSAENVNFISVSSIGGCLTGVIFIVVSLLVSHLAETYFRHFLFLRSWAIALCCWGSTSFHNLDLSEVNFRGAKLANTDLRARKLYRTCFQGVTGLERAKVDSRYIDLENPKVQKLLTQTQDDVEKQDFSQLNLRGAYLQNKQMRRCNFTDSDLTGADMQGADLRGSIFVRTQVIGVDFTGADLTGICIEDWSVNSQTKFTNVTCDYVYRKLDEKGEGCDRLPIDRKRNFDAREFESLYQEVENVIEVIFQEGENWQAALYSLIKLQMEDESLELQLKGVEKRGDIWVVKVTYNEAYPKQEVEKRLNATVDEMKHQLAAKNQQIHQLEQEKYKLLEIAGYQAEALKAFSKLPLGNSNIFFVSGSNITNLSGSGQIEYSEAAAQIRSIVAHSADSGQSTNKLNNLLAKLQKQSLAQDIPTQAEFIQQMILAEANQDIILKQYLIKQQQQIVDAFPEGAIATAMRDAIAQLERA